jgi:pyruvate,water dikinase
MDLRQVQKEVTDPTRQEQKEFLEDFRDQMANISLPTRFAEQLILAVDSLWPYHDARLPVAVRSSCSAEDGASSSSAGQYESFLGVTTTAELLLCVRRCYSSVLTQRSVLYRRRRNLPLLPPMAVLVQVLIEAEKSGVVFTKNPDLGDSRNMIIEATWGLGDLLVAGEIIPDHFIVARQGDNVIQNPGTKRRFSTFSRNGVLHQSTPPDKRNRTVLSYSEIQQLKQISLELERLFGAPQDVEWAMNCGNISILQSRPITAFSKALCEENTNHAR